jgi:hypothetical protein
MVVPVPLLMEITIFGAVSSANALVAISSVKIAKAGKRTEARRSPRVVIIALLLSARTGS